MTTDDIAKSLKKLEEQMVTKSDLKVLRSEVRGDIDEFRSEMKEDIQIIKDRIDLVVTQVNKHTQLLEGMGEVIGQLYDTTVHRDEFEIERKRVDKIELQLGL